MSTWGYGEEIEQSGAFIPSDSNQRIPFYIGCCQVQILEFCDILFFDKLYCHFKKVEVMIFQLKLYDIADRLSFMVSQGLKEQSASLYSSHFPVSAQSPNCPHGTQEKVPILEPLQYGKGLMFTLMNDSQFPGISLIKCNQCQI